MKKQKTTNMDNVLAEILESVPPASYEKARKKLMLAAKIADAMKAKGWKKKDLMQSMGQKNQSVISRWLSGTHNFTIETLFDLEAVLGINLVDVDEKKPVVVEYRLENVASESIEPVNPAEIRRRITSRRYSFSLCQIQAQC